MIINNKNLLYYLINIDEFKKLDIKKYNWHDISNYKYLNENFIFIFKNKLNMKQVQKKNLLTCRFLRKIDKYLDWDLISEFQELDETFLYDYNEYLNWNLICIHQKLDSNLIDLFNNKVNWSLISRNQKLNNYIIEKYSKYDFGVLN